MQEIWKDIKNYEGLYYVSNLGNVRNRKIILKQHLNDKGYLYVSLSKHNKRKYYRVHRLVANAFISNPNNFLEVNHKDENKLNNCVDNLEFCSRFYNMNYGKISKKLAESHFKKINQYSLDGDFIKIWSSIKEATEFYKNSHIRDVLKGRRKTASGYVWKYCEFDNN